MNQIKVSEPYLKEASILKGTRRYLPFSVSFGDNSTVAQTDTLNALVKWWENPLSKPLENGVREVESEMSSNYPISPRISDPIHSRPAAIRIARLLGKCRDAAAPPTQSVSPCSLSPRAIPGICQLWSQKSKLWEPKGGTRERIRKWSISHVFALCTGLGWSSGVRAREGVIFPPRA